MNKLNNTPHSAYDQIKSAYTTEKAFKMQENGVYTFMVDRHADKPSIQKAINEFFNVKVADVRFVNTRKTGKSFKGNKGKAKIVKKAYVCLEKGEKIDLNVKA